MSNLSIFQFESHQVRVVLYKGQPWFVANDIAAILDYADPSMMIRLVDEDDKEVVNPQKLDSVSLTETLSHNTFRLTLINESGLYACIFGSHKAQAKAFKKWVTSVVLVSIRETGGYQMPGREALEMQYGDRPELRDLDLAAAMFGKRFGLAYEQRYLMQQVKKHHPQLAGSEPEPEEKASVSAGDALLTPTDIARELGLFYKTGNPNAQAVNKLLEKLGYQVRVGKQWSATEKATKLALCDRKPIETNSRSQKDQMLWSSKIIPILKEYILK